MAVVIVVYIAINIYNHFRLVVIVANNFIGFIFSDLSMRFSNKLSP